MKSFFQTSRQRSFLSACRITGKKWSASVPLLLAALLAVVFYSCRDEDLTPSMLSFEQGGTRADAASTSGLEVVQNATYGATYKPNCRVPLVGEGRVINQITKGLIAVGANNENQEFLIDKDLTNGVTVSGLAKVDAGIPIFSVRDINRVYYNDNEEQGVKVGFVYEPQGGVLDLSVLKSFYVQTLLNGKVQDSSLSESGGGFQLLNLNLLNVAGGKYEVSFDATKPFDEVRLGYAGVNVDVSVNQSAKFYYAFVGENPEKIAAEGYTYTEAKGEETYSIPGGLIEGWKSCDVLTDEYLFSNGDRYGLISGLSFKKYRVNFNAEIPAGSEIGFRTSTATILNVNLGGVTMHALNADNKSQQAMPLGTGIGLSAVGGDNKNFSFITTKAARGVQIDFPLSVKLEATTIHYAYSRDPVEIDVSSYFTIGNDTISTDYYNLPTPSEGRVSYSLVSWPEGATSSISGNRMTGMTVNGDYVVKAIYTRGEETSWSYAVIHRNKKEAGAGCNTMMINTSGNPTQYSVEEPLGAQGGISLFNKIEDTQNLVDADYDNYAKATNVLSLIQLGGLASVKSNKEINTQNGKTRVGFVMQTNNQLLGADVLKFFFIRLYNNGEEVFSGLTAENDAVGVGLVGNDGSKLRFYVETDKTFNQVELWTAGLLNVNLNTFRLYYAFYESTTCEEYAGTSEACMEMITAQKHGATINYAETKYPSVVGVGSTMNNLSYVIDNSQQTAASIVAGVSLISRSTVAVKFNRVRGGQPVGAILRTPEYVLSASVLQNVTIAAYNGGQAVASESTSGGLASIEVISDAGLAYMEVTPLQDYDEVRISFPSLADALKTIWLSGFYIRPDANGNGIPDCAEEPEDQGETDGITYESITEHVCVDEATYLGKVRISVDAQDDKVGTKLTFTCYPYDGNGQKIEQEATLLHDNDGYFFELSLPVGDYSISGLPTYNGLRAQVHPLKTTWKRNPVNTDWNNWSNWTDGSPWGCTNVVIPTGATKYPVLEQNVHEFYGGNYCDNIHFEPGGAVLNTQYLNYSYAYVEMEITAGEYHMISTPLCGMVTGDMFVSSEMPAYFTQLDDKTYPEVRHNPLVRQKMYSRTVETATLGVNDKNTVAAIADWSRTFNAVAQEYDPAQGIKMMVGNAGDNTKYRLRFPKEYTIYNYYNLSGVLQKPESFGPRTKNGRFAHEANNNSFTFTLKNEVEGAEYFVAGNPFMSYIDVEQFLSNNSNNISAIKLVETDEIINSSNANGTQIAPMQAFYVVANAASNLKELSITYTQDMFVQPSASTATRSSRSASVPSASEMKISATSGGSVSTCSLVLSAEASDSYSAKEDVVSLIDEDFMPKVKVYTVADKRALDIQKMNNAKHVDLGFVVKDGTQNAEITLNYGNNWKGWTLVDKQTGNRYKLNGNTVSVNASALKSNDSRFYLEKQ